MDNLTTKDKLIDIALSIEGIILMILGLIYSIQTDDIDTGISIVVLGAVTIVYARVCLIDTKLQNLIKRSDL